MINVACNIASFISYHRMMRLVNYYHYHHYDDVCLIYIWLQIIYTYVRQSSSSSIFVNHHLCMFCFVFFLEIWTKTAWNFFLSVSFCFFLFLLLIVFVQWINDENNSSIIQIMIWLDWWNFFLGKSLDFCQWWWWWKSKLYSGLYR